MITQSFQTLTPCYNRDYKKKADVEADFRAGKDFYICPLGSPREIPCSIADFAPGVIVNIRFRQLRSVAVIKV